MGDLPEIVQAILDRRMMQDDRSHWTKWAGQGMKTFEDRGSDGWNTQEEIAILVSEIARLQTALVIAEDKSVEEDNCCSGCFYELGCPCHDDEGQDDDPCPHLVDDGAGGCSAYKRGGWL